MDGLLDTGFADSGLLAEAAAGLGSGLASLLDELAYGLVITAPGAALLHANQAARHELGRFRALGLAGNTLRTRSAEDDKRLHDALAHAADGKRCFVTLARQQEAGLTIAVIPLRSEGRLAPARAALVFARASVCESLMLGFFARSHGLTATEEHVLGILCQGHSAPDIAVQMKVAVSTVRSHVRSLCAKTRCSGVRELVNRVAVLPPVAPALRHERMH
ncbi:MAG: LuxR C-terminal-related transcriptional regulator [Ramlibacter sp.]